jgi:hypothetical protein
LLCVCISQISSKLSWRWNTNGNILVFEIKKPTAAGAPKQSPNQVSKETETEKVRKRDAYKERENNRWKRERKMKRKLQIKRERERERERGIERSDMFRFVKVMLC